MILALPLKPGEKSHFYSESLAYGSTRRSSSQISRDEKAHRVGKLILRVSVGESVFHPRDLPIDRCISHA